MILQPIEPRVFFTPDRIIVEPALSAKAASLYYVTDTKPGIKRQRVGRGFHYVRADGKRVRDAATLARIQSLVIPPAWINVWICPKANGHLQATGRDSAGRKQYLYHSRWRTTRDETKYNRLMQFGLALPRIRRRIRRDLRQRSIGRQRVLAVLVRLLETTFIRIGNTEYATANNSFGLTTLKDRHVDVTGSTIRFNFHGKSGVKHTIDLNDKRLAKLVKRCQELPGQELFQYLDERGKASSVGSADVNDYLREISGEDFTAKDFRTWAGTVMAAEALSAKGQPTSPTQARKAVAEILKQVAKKLGNTPAVCRKSYVHPAVIAAYEDGSLAHAWKKHSGRKRLPTRELHNAEVALLRLLDSHSSTSARVSKAG